MCQKLNWHSKCALGLNSGIVHESSGNSPVKDIRIQVETWDGCITIWYERSKLKNACDVIAQRVNNQLAGLNLKRVEVSLMPGTVQKLAQGGLRFPPIRSIVTSVQTNHMTFVEGLIASGYVFNDEDFDCAWVKIDADGFYHLYQENEDDETDTLWNYVKMTEDFDVIKEQTFTV